MAVVRGGRASRIAGLVVFPLFLRRVPNFLFVSNVQRFAELAVSRGSRKHPPQRNGNYFIGFAAEQRVHEAAHRFTDACATRLFRPCPSQPASARLAMTVIGVGILEFIMVTPISSLPRATRSDTGGLRWLVSPGIQRSEYCPPLEIGMQPRHSAKVAVKFDRNAARWE